MIITSVNLEAGCILRRTLINYVAQTLSFSIVLLLFAGETTTTPTQGKKKVGSSQQVALHFL
jgi:hypothetical protein